MNIAAGDTFINSDRRDIGIPAHLWIILNDPVPQGGDVLIVNVTSSDAWDTTCILEPGVHAFVHKRSYVNYPEARLTTNAAVEQLISAGLAHFHDRVTPEVLARIREGAARSPMLKKKHLEFLQNHGAL